MKNIYILGGIAVLGCAVIGLPKIASHADTLVKEVREEVNQLSPAPHEKERISNLLKKRRRQISEEYNKIAKVERTSHNVKKEVKQLSTEIEKQTSFLVRAEEILLSGVEEHRIGKTVYTMDQIETDAINRIHTLENLTIQKEAKEKIAFDLLQAANIQSKNLAMAENDMAKMHAELQTLDIRLQAAKLKSLSNSLTDDLLHDGFGGYDELTQSFASYQDRVEEDEISAGVDRPGQTRYPVEWDSQDDHRDLIENMRKYTGGGPKDEPITQTASVAYETN